jgi:hypothetical protein
MIRIRIGKGFVKLPAAIGIILMLLGALITRISESGSPAPKPTDAEAAAHHPESFYQNKWCAEHRGRIEVVTRENTRCDCVTDAYAVDFDFGNKWAEAVGQSLHYAHMTGKPPGVVLIIETPADRRYWRILNDTIRENRLSIRTRAAGDGA